MHRARARRPGGSSAAARRLQTPSPSGHSTTNPIRPRPTCREPRRQPQASPPRQWRRRALPLRSLAEGGSFRKTILEEDLNRAEAVAPADLLALRAAARLEADRQLEDRMAGAQQLGGNLRFDVETVRFKTE